MTLKKSLYNLTVSALVSALLTANSYIMNKQVNNLCSKYYLLLKSNYQFYFPSLSQKGV